MGKNPEQLNQKQFDVLRWIKDGCPEGVYERIYAVKVRELRGPGGSQLPPRRWSEKRSRPAWIETRGWEFISTGKLELVVDGPGTRYDGDRYRDAKTVAVEARLPDVFRSLEIYRLQADWQARKREREQAERERQWEAAVATAKRRYDAQTRWEQFEECSRQWQRIGRHRDFLGAARSALEGVDGPLRSAVGAQLDFAERTLDELDPLHHPELLVPRVPDPLPEDLKPFLDGRSPYGPERQGW